MERRLITQRAVRTSFGAGAWKAGAAVVAAALVAGFLLSGTQARATLPEYTQALTDLHYAQYLLMHDAEQGQVSQTESKALAAVNQAIHDVASGTGIYSSPGAPPPVSGHVGLLNAVIGYLNTAYNDLKVGNSDVHIRGWRLDARNEIRAAEDLVRQARGQDVGEDRPKECDVLAKAQRDLTGVREDYNETLAAFGPVRDEAYNDVIGLRNRTNDSLRDIESLIARRCQ
jgi:hypothetical protein